MKKFAPYGVLIFTVLIFFYKTLALGTIPFPGDLLLAGYAPWNHQSYNGYVAGAIPTKNQYFDVIRELYPWKTLVTEELKNGRIPLWNPYNFSGSPLLANYQSQVLYPLTFLYFLLPQVAAWTIMVIIQPLLGTVFVYLFATEIGFSVPAAILSSVLFNFSGFAGVWMEFSTIWQTILWLPLLLFLVERAVKNRGLSRKFQLLFLFGLYCMITAGHPQDFINSFIFLLIYAFARMRAAKYWYIPFAYLFTVPFLIAAPQILPTAELFRSSARVVHDYTGIITKMLVQWWQFPLLVVSDFFGNPATGTNFTGDFVGKTLSVGMTGFFLTATLLWHREKSWFKNFFFCTALVILLLTVRTPVSALLYRYPWPILSTGTPTRILVIFLFAVSMLAGIGFDGIRASRKNPRIFLVSLWGLLIILWAFVIVHPSIAGLDYTAQSVSIMKRAMFLATGIGGGVTVIYLVAGLNKRLIYLLIPLAAAELLWGFLKFNPFVPVSFVYPENKVITGLRKISGIDRFWGYGTAEVEANFATQVHLFSPDGTDPLNLAWYNRFIQSSRNGNLAATFNRTTRSDALLAPGYGKTDLPDNTFRLRVMDMLGVKYILDRSENPQDSGTFPISRFKLLEHVDDWTIYENIKAAPRFFLTGDVRPYSDTADFEKQFFAEDFDPGKTVLVQADDYVSLPHFTPSGQSATLVSYTPSKVIIRTETQTPSFLFLSDTYDYGWRVSVNGNKMNVVRTNFSFRGVTVPAGVSTVIFSYEPESFTAGVAVSLFTLLCTAGYFIYSYKRKGNK